MDDRAQVRDALAQFSDGYVFSGFVGDRHISGAEYYGLFSGEMGGFGPEGDGGRKAVGERFEKS